jgi:hypothetical protein
MEYYLVLALSRCLHTTYGQNDSTPTLKSILLEQLKTTHNVKDWFMPVNTAIAGLTPTQVNWKYSTGNHSIAQLSTHFICWNKQVLDKFKGISPDVFSGNNKETFSEVNEKTWTSSIKTPDKILTAWKVVVQNADAATLKKWYSTIAHIGTHNAYHTVQILYIRKMKGWWDDENGVK